MVFIDSHSLIIHSELNREIKKLESEKKALESIINNDKNTIKQLNNIDSLERFARENYGHKKLVSLQKQRKPIKFHVRSTSRFK